MVAGHQSSRSQAIPRRIRAARELRGWTQREVVDQMARPISPAALSQIEGGRTRASESTLQELADVLKVPIGFFAAQWPTTGAPEDEPVTFFRDLRSTSTRERKRAAAYALLLADLLAAIQVHVRIPDVDLPHYPIGVGAKGEEVERAAFTSRAAWGLDNHPIPSVVRELERHGVPIARLTIGNRKVDAFTCEYGTRPIVLLTNDKSNYVRSRFDASHELGHLVMHDGAEPGTRGVENQAQQFAGAFLLPREVAEDELPRRIDGSGWIRLAELKRRWGMSMTALLYRAKTLRVISDETHRSAMVVMSQRGWRSTEPGDREMGPPEAPLLIERALTTIEVEHKLKVIDLIRAAELPEDETIELVQAAIDQRPQVDLEFAASKAPANYNTRGKITRT